MLGHWFLTWTRPDAWRRRAAKLGSRPRRPRPLTLSNEGALDHVPLRFGEQIPAAAHILPPFLGLPDVHVCASGYRGVLTLAVGTPKNGAPIVERFLNALLRQLPIESGAFTTDRLALPAPDLPWRTGEPAFDPRGADVTGGVAAYG